MEEGAQQNIQASDNSVAVGSVSIGGSIAGNLTIGNTGFSADQVSTLIKQISTTFHPKPFDGKCPYKGLDVFEEDDAELFFGREKAVDELVCRVEESRTVFITGPSGSGKSSLVRAGLVHALKTGAVKNSERWLYATMKPGRDPFDALAGVFSRLKSPDLGNYFKQNITKAQALHECAESALSERADQRLVLFMDQFEEVFTQLNAEKAGAFIEMLAHAAAVENGRVILLFAMRSDFVSNCATYPKLNALLNRQFVQIGAMQADELVSAIAQPALRVGLRIDPDLIAQIINDMQGEPGALPLMQFALKDLFSAQQSKGGLITLTLNDYLQRGGIRKALERHADDSFNKLDGHEQELARSIFSGLIEIGRGTQDTRRTAIFDELIPASVRSDEIEGILRKLADARLITTDEVAGKDTVTISHEKLIDAWPWLKKLVNENRGVIALQNEISEDAREWDVHNRDTSYLYTGARLGIAREQLTAQKIVLSGLAKAFIEQGIAQREAEKKAKETLRRRIIGGLIAGIVVALVLAGFAVLQMLNAQTQSKIALARQLAAQVMPIQADRPDLALLLGVQAVNIDNSRETRGSLLSASQCCSDPLISFMKGHTDSVWDVAFSPDSAKLASSGNDGSIIIWDVATRRKITRIINPDSSVTVYTIAFSPTEEVLAAGDGKGLVLLYDTKTWKRIGEPFYAHESSVLSIKFSKDGKWLVSSGTDGKVLVWDMTSRQLYKTFTGNSNWVWDVAISPDSKTVVSVGLDKTLRLWSLEHDVPVDGQKVDTLAFVSATFNEDAQHPLLLTGDRLGRVTIWDMRPWQEKHKPPMPSESLSVTPGATTSVWGLVFVPGNNFSFVTGRNKGTLNWNRIILNDDFSKISLEPEILGVTSHSIGVFRIDISPDGKLIAAAGQDGLVSLWGATGVPSMIKHTAKVKNLQVLAGQGSIVSIDEGGVLIRHDYIQQKKMAQIVLNTPKVFQSAISADGTKVATVTETGLVSLWDGKTGKKLDMQKNYSSNITSMVFSPDGGKLVSSDEKGNVILWVVTKNNFLVPIASFTTTDHSAIQKLLFHPDGKTLIGGGCGYPITFPVKTPDCSQGAVFIWDTELGLQLLDKLPGKAGFVWSMALNPANPDELATGTRDGTITILNWRKKINRLTIQIGASDIAALAFSPDGKLLAVADGYKIILYSTESGQVYGSFFKEHDLAATSLGFSPDGHLLFSGSTDETVLIHDLSDANWLTRACRIANRNLTRAEWQQYIGDALPYQKVCENLPLESEIPATPTSSQ